MTYKKTLLQKFNDKPYNFSLTKSLDIITLHTKYFSIKHNLSFSPKYSEISSVEGIYERHVELYTNISGIIGIDGTLPNVYIEQYILYNRNSKQAIRDFLDIFYSRYIQLYYKFLKNNIISCISDQLENTVIGKILIKMSGYNEALDFYNKYYSNISLQLAIATHNIFWQAERSINGLRILLQDFFNIPVKIEEFVPKLITVDISEQTRIGSQTGKYNVLHRSAILDRKHWNLTDTINVIIKALQFDQYIEFLPKYHKDNAYSKLQKLRDLVKMYVPFGITAIVKIYLQKGIVIGTSLNRSKRLNRDAFISGMHRETNTHFKEVI